MGAEWVRQKAWANPGCRMAVVSPTAGDVRKVCVEGESGLLSVIPEALLVKDGYNRSTGEIRLINGSLISTVSAMEPGRLRGPQFHYAWADELAAWDYPEAWDQLNFTLRLGQRPQVMVTTTPRPVPMIRDLMARPDVCIQRGRSYDNAANLAPAALAHLEATYGGTRLGRQELEGELLEDVEGALWHRAQVEACYLPEAPTLKRVVVGVDPAGGVAETGIVVCGLGTDGKGYVLADLSMAGSPDAWGRAVVEAYHGWNADRVVVERNFGGDMAEHTIRTVDRQVPIRMVTASRGKILRAEPVAAIYEQHRVHHVGRFPKLEDQMCTYTVEDKVSPDRLDALVWALNELLVTGRTPPTRGPGSVTRESPWG